MKRDSYRTKFFDYDARRNPKTKLFCAMCQKDIKPGSQYRMVHLVSDGMQILHPADEAHYTEPHPGDDRGLHKVGMACAKVIGMDWTTAPPKGKKS